MLLGGIRTFFLSHYSLQSSVDATNKIYCHGGSQHLTSKAVTEQTGEKYMVNHKTQHFFYHKDVSDCVTVSWYGTKCLHVSFIYFSLRCRVRFYQ